MCFGACGAFSIGLLGPQKRGRTSLLHRAKGTGLQACVLLAAKLEEQTPACLSSCEKKGVCAMQLQCLLGNAEQNFETGVLMWRYWWRASGADPGAATPRWRCGWWGPGLFKKRSLFLFLSIQCFLSELHAPGQDSGHSDCAYIYITYLLFMYIYIYQILGQPKYPFCVELMA